MSARTSTLLALAEIWGGLIDLYLAMNWSKSTKT
jgi:hypothetical protein